MCYRTRKCTVCMHFHASLSLEILQAGAVKGSVVPVPKSIKCVVSLLTACAVLLFSVDLNCCSDNQLLFSMCSVVTLYANWFKLCVPETNLFSYCFLCCFTVILCHILFHVLFTY